jgi:L-alanine-DL-glutamate epimerase-like enolase superfamily enzyme
LQDILDLQSVCHGVNVKLVKAGGLEPAVAMVRQANKSGLKVLVGCMSESTCGAMAAAQLSPWADWVDLDGPRLIKNDPFSGAVYSNGSLVVSPDSGTGALPENKSIFGRV